MKTITLFLLLFGGAFAYGQTYTTVTGTVTDAHGMPYVNGTFNARLDISNSSIPTTGGNRLRLASSLAPYDVINGISGDLDKAGAFSVSLVANGSITPASTHWVFTICAADKSTCFSSSQTISGTSQSLTTALSAAALPYYTVNTPAAKVGLGGLTFKDGTNQSTAGGGVGAGIVCNANIAVGADLGAQINACDAILGATTGEIQASGGGTIATQVVVSANHTLRLYDGTYTPAATVTTSYLQAFPIVLKSNSSLICESWSTILMEPTQANIWTVVSPFNAMNTSAGRGTDSNVHMDGCHVMGAHGSFNSTTTTVELGNCVHCSATHFWLDATKTLGMGAGGLSDTGNHADGIWMTDNLFTNVGSQNLYVVNGRDVHINRNILRAMGQVGSSGVAGIDIEPNLSTDWADNIEIVDNIIDNIDAVGSGTTANGIVVQNGALTNFGPVMVHGNDIRGGAIDGEVTQEMSNGIIVDVGTRDVSVTNNFVRRVQQDGLNIGGDRSYVRGNHLVCVGTASFPGIYVIGTNGIIADNEVIDPGTCGSASATITEVTGADHNIYSNNVAQQVVLVGANSKIATHIDSTGVGLIGQSAFANATLGGAQFSALAVPTINGGSSGPITIAGGTLANATYGYKVTATSVSGETVGSAEVQETTAGGQNAINLQVNGVAGALTYKIYGRTAGSGWAFIAAIPAFPASPVNTLTYIDKGTVSPSGAIPTADSSGAMRLASSTALWTSSAGAPSGNCTVGSIDSNSSAASASTVLYVCYPANTWTAVTVP